MAGISASSPPPRDFKSSPSLPKTQAGQVRNPPKAKSADLSKLRKVVGGIVGLSALTSGVAWAYRNRTMAAFSQNLAGAEILTLTPFPRQPLPPGFEQLQPMTKPPTEYAHKTLQAVPAPITTNPGTSKKSNQASPLPTLMVSETLTPKLRETGGLDAPGGISSQPPITQGPCTLTQTVTVPFTIPPLTFDITLPIAFPITGPGMHKAEFQGPIADYRRFEIGYGVDPMGTLHHVFVPPPP